MTAPDELVERLNANADMNAELPKVTHLHNTAILEREAAAELTRLRERVAELEAEMSGMIQTAIIYRRQIREQRGLLAAMMIRCSMSTGHGDTLADLVTELEPQIEALRADAERYRWLRSNRRVGNAKLMMWATGQGRYDDVSQEAGMDAAIDAVRGKNNEEM